MSRIRMKVFLRNESDTPLMFAGGQLSSGDYTPGWTPPAVIPPGERKGFQGEGDIGPFEVPVTGTEGRVRYNVAGGGGQLYIHWNSPLIESQYGNTFHIWAPSNWEVSHRGGQGHSATLEIRFRRTAYRSVRAFHPHGRGFAFTNRWSGKLPVISLGYLWNRLFESLPGPLADLGIDRLADEDWLPITHANAGLCGGMVYAVMDYHNHHLLPPDLSTPPTSVDHQLFKYIRDRLWDSFDVGGEGHRFLGYSSPHYPNGDEGVFQNVLGLTRGRSWITYREAWPAIQDDIDAGRLSPIALIQTDSLDIGANHQVLAYAYERSGQDVTLYIYDPNEGQREVALTFNVTDTTGAVHVTRRGGKPENGRRIFCLFRINGYEQKMPPSGRRIQSLRAAIRATSRQADALSLRHAMTETNAAAEVSTVRWLRSI